MSKNNEELSDDFVASLLSKEASEKNIKYSALGLQAFLPKRSATNAPKPNTRFLRNIVREADNHNAALLAREAEESKERLRQLHLKERAKRRGEVDGVPVEKSRAAQRPDRQIYTVGAKRRGDVLGVGKVKRMDAPKGIGAGPWTEEVAVRVWRRKRDGAERRADHEIVGDQENADGTDLENIDLTAEGKVTGIIPLAITTRRARKAPVIPTSTLSSHRSDKKDRSSETTSKSYSSRPRSPRRRPEESDADHERRRKRRKEMELAEEPGRSSRASTDPLDDIIGPGPAPATRIRGRGTLSGASAMDARFSESYDPSLDVQPDVADGDDWDDALEAYRDRQKWKALGAERLRTEGFGEDFIKAWENNDTKNTANIKWSKEGVREWDRGKVIEEGEVKVKAIWSKD
ncbi:uncharacterized protein H6S33_002510 [Morchella sextelata]|uniref:uncharacterized protein n=1 Tax=Morchella sextelata TaxID=1174677 RepID=UPI001D05587B|nr:uncharacterized protein H6S33_002510 [Morchella sextelata]KAH0607476.1 hypothetical protein H6S33_002510 [Morchella sextelata]